MMYLQVVCTLLVCVVAAPCIAQSSLDWQPFGASMTGGHAQPVLVYIQASWCGACRRLERETFADAQVRNQLRRWTLSALTIDDFDRLHRVGPYQLSEAAWATRLGIDTTPSFVLLRPDGSILARHTGFLPPDGLLTLLAATDTTNQSE